ncbi:MAG: PEP-CTERM/exosortase system-associated acyltransferase, partial [Lysobacterales bacterium]
MEPQNQSLAERFQQYFDVDFAGSLEQKSAVYRIRYRVYCEDLEYEPADLFPDRLERDIFDEHSLHCLITHRRSGKHAGCVRLVAAGGPYEGGVLPFEKNCPGSVAPEFFSARNLQRESMCEISRLAVDRLFRRRTGEQVTRLGEENAMDCTHQEMRTFSLIAVAGFLAATALTEITGRTDVFAMMEPFLPRLLKRSGIEFERAGEDLEYHGTRAPYFIKTEWATNNMRPDLRELY